MRKAVRAFQSSRALPVTGKLDKQDARGAQEDGEEQLLTAYVVTGEDVAGPYERSPST
jgi:hypothetical protein